MQQLRGTFCFWACIIIVNMNLLESNINLLFTVFWICMAAYFAAVSWEEGEPK